MDTSTPAEIKGLPEEKNLRKSTEISIAVGCNFTAHLVVLASLVLAPSCMLNMKTVLKSLLVGVVNYLSKGHIPLPCALLLVNDKLSRTATF